ncbi:MAG: class I SAM-dependent methyltransferase [Ignavibacteriales bacterium]|nr:MAG: class I SAM-dependent methyltransferase [Ignavibacteriales bacterium]
MDNLKIIADAYEAEIEVVEFLPYLLQDLWALGSYPDQTVEEILSLNLPKETTRILDLGCGKGILGISLAKRFGYKVKGIDAFSSFIEFAKEKSKEYNVSNHTEFVCGDIKEMIENESGYTVAVLSSVGQIWGSYTSTIKKIRECVLPGGYIILEEGFLVENSGIENQNYISYESIVNQITAAGDEIVKETIFPGEWLIELNKQNNKFIQQRAAELYEKYPGKAEIIKQYAHRQIAECEFLEKNFRSAMWVLKKI